MSEQYPPILAVISSVSLLYSGDFRNFHLNVPNFGVPCDVIGRSSIRLTYADILENTSFLTVPSQCYLGL